jgi:hypothetical protein
MYSSATRRLSLPFSTQRTSDSGVEAAAVFAVAEFERSKGGGFIARQPEEKLVYISKIGYPLWLFPKNNQTFVFDGFADSSFGISYFEVPSAKEFMENLEANSRPREKYTAFLSDYSSYFQRSIKEKQFVFRGLIASQDFKGEFNVYRKEAIEAVSANFGLLSPSLDEVAISAVIGEFDKLQLFLREDAEKLPECQRLLTKTTSQYITELDYESEAALEETNAKIKAQEEIVNPKVAKLTKEYKQKMKSLTDSFEKELENLQKQNAKTVKSIRATEEKIRLCQREGDAQAERNHKIYAKRWKDKVKQTQKELGTLKKELKTNEDKTKKISKQQSQEISQLNFALDAEIKFARQPLRELETARDAKVLAFKQETEKLLKQEKPVMESLDKSIKLREAVRINFEGLSISDPGLRNSGLYYVPFYVACYEVGLTRRYLIVPPSTVGDADFSSKLKSTLGISKSKNLLVPRFKAIGALIGKVQALTKQNMVFESQLASLAQRNNLLSNVGFRENVEKGLGYLKREGWLSDKQQLTLSSRLKS